MSRPTEVVLVRIELVLFEIKKEMCGKTIKTLTLGFCLGNLNGYPLSPPPSVVSGGVIARSEVAIRKERRRKGSESSYCDLQMLSVKRFECRLSIS
jgi:hypothetical protein